MATSTRKEIRNYLNLCRLAARDSFIIARRDENQKTIRELGFTQDIVREIILSLTDKDYCDGPCSDRGYKGEVWIFGLLIEGKEVYIKLHLSSYNNPGDKVPTLYCISFHFANRQMIFPYK